MRLARTIALFAAVILLGAGCDAQEPLRDQVAPSPSPPAPSTPASAPAEVMLDVTGMWAWALVDRRTGETHGSENRASATSSTESLVKAWLAADYLAGLDRGAREPTAAEIRTVRRALRVSDDAAAQRLYLARGGDATIRRMITTCELTGTAVHSGRWALTQITAQDTARLGACIANGDVLDDRWTAWLLHEMRNVAPSNGFGIREAFEAELAEQIAVKNGWTARSDTGQWHVSCLGVWDTWSLAVLARYPVRLGLEYGAAICRDVARQLFV